MVPVVSIVGKSNSGKTTLIEKLIPELKERGYRVGTIKHCGHDHEFDREGTDSWRHVRVGSEATLVVSPSRLALFKGWDSNEELDRFLDFLFDGYDLVLMEGFKSAPGPKIEVFDPTKHSIPLCSAGDDLVALVTDERLPIEVPTFPRTALVELTDFIEERFLACTSQTWRPSS